MLRTTPKPAQAPKKLNKRGDRAIARAIQARVAAVTAACAFPVEDLAIPKKGSLAPQPFQELKARGDRAKARRDELIHRLDISSHESQELRGWLHSIHHHKP